MEDWSDFLDPITDLEGNVTGWSDASIWGCIASVVITIGLIIIAIPFLALVKGIRFLKKGAIGSALIAFSIPLLYVVVLSVWGVHHYLEKNMYLDCTYVEVIIYPEQEAFQVVKTERFPDLFTVYVFFHYDNWISGKKLISDELDVIARSPDSAKSILYPLHYHEHDWMTEARALLAEENMFEVQEWMFQSERYVFLAGYFLDPSLNIYNDERYCDGNTLYVREG